jgi:alpha-tubulin suppressor-like RCC1 family protein
VWGTGSNSQGELGLNDTTNRNIPTKIQTLENIIEIASRR